MFDLDPTENASPEDMHFHYYREEVVKELKQIGLDIEGFNKQLKASMDEGFSPGGFILKLAETFATYAPSTHLKNKNHE